MSAERALELLSVGDSAGAEIAAGGVQDEVARVVRLVALARNGKFEECRRAMSLAETLLSLDPSVQPSRAGWTKAGGGVAHPGEYLTLVGLGGASIVFANTLSTDLPVVIEAIVRRRGGSDDDCAFGLTTRQGSDVVRVNAREVVLRSAGAAWPIEGDDFNHLRLVVGPEGSSLAVNGIVVIRSRATGPAGAARLSFGVHRGALPADAESHWLCVRAVHPERADDVGEAAGALIAARIERRVGRPARALAYLARAADGGVSAALVDEARLATAALAESDEFSPTRLRPLLEALPANAAGPLLATYVEPREVRRVIVCERVGVRFALDPSRRMSVKDLVLSPFTDQPARPSWWALQDVTFDLSQGDILGVIGANGAGKSTLLRVLAEMLAPDAGTVNVQGRPLLLTPGLGFREELSGRDNVRLGGVFLGLTRREISRKYEEIVEFAEMKSAMDRPFKFYSDGMKARLIFAVATAVEPDILMLDELLSAGDIHFQEKAATRMRELLRRARAIVVVTHSMGFVRTECTKALYIESGHVRYFGDPTRAVEHYLADIGAESQVASNG